MKTLIVVPAWVGDTVLAGSLIECLLAQDPRTEIHVLAPAATAPLATRIRGVARCHVLPLGHGELALTTRMRVGVALRAQAFERAIVLPNTWKSALVPLVARIPVRIGWHGEARYGLFTDRRRGAERLEKMVERFAALAFEPNAPLPDVLPRPKLAVDRDNARSLVARFALDSTHALALCPGAEYGPAKRWPAGHFAALAERHAARGGESWLLGSRNDRAAADALLDALPPERRACVKDLVGETSLPDAVDLLSLASAVVANDSGLMHVAAALDRPLVALFGSSSAAFTPPLSEHAHVLENALPCRPCFARVCRFGHTNCLTGIAPERVLSVLDGHGPRDDARTEANGR